MKAQTINATAYYTCNEPGAHKLPNAAQRRYYTEKVVDGILAAAITLAVLLIGVVLVTM